MISILDNIDEESYENALFDALPEQEITYLEYEKILNSLKPYLTEVDFAESYRFPEKLSSKEELKKLKRQKKLQFIPASCLGILTQFKQTKGVLNELNQIANQEQFSKPLQILLTNQELQNEPWGNSEELTIPANLSLAQRNIIQTAQKETLSVVIGPPGTGKSFTISALAVEAMNNGQSVLIASKTNTAVDVIADKIEKQLGLEDCVVRGGRKEYLKSLKKYLEDILAGIGIPDNAAHHSNFHKIKAFGKDYQFHSENIQENIRHIEWLIDWTLKKSPIIKKEVKGFLKKWFHQWQTKKIEAQLNERKLLQEYIQKISEYLLLKNQILSDLITLKHQDNLRRSLNWDRQTIKTFLSAIRARRDTRQEELFNEINLKEILQILPIWLVNLSDIYDVLPLEKELFDLTIIDEASQCDIASCLPIFQRAKQVVIVGDTKQLRHISFLSRAKQEKFREDYQIKQELDYREESILDLTQERLGRQSQINFLNEHFRSYPSIIQFSNQQFYQRALKLMKPNHEVISKPVELIQIEGKRHSSGHNEAEADFIIQKIIEITATSEEYTTIQSIGILSPFRSQVDYIAKQLSEKLPLATIQKYDIEVGTAHSFQGNERDLMFISWVVDDESKGGSFNHLNKEDLFNVSITRASEKQYILLSVNPQNLAPKSLLRQYIHFIQENEEFSESKNQSTQNQNNVILEIKQSLEKKGYDCQFNYIIANTRIDLLIEKEEKQLGIDIITNAYSSNDLDFFEKYLLLQRSGLDFTYVSELEWYFRKEEVLTSLLSEKEFSINS